ncbi:hypothetical protein GPL17_37055 [Bradyrhizobium yuanmingense]|uniref:hypothetical protein n=1 Tax=Bradyrhizobium yuanmingense TaxID=108015 RepID=UPI0012F921EE|nr:hypothetical protein [Bradyrhizobium yuanmingense]MVT55982.1 hypothetical protein [Bradyrhizobium yuanmingense]
MFFAIVICSAVRFKSVCSERDAKGEVFRCAAEVVASASALYIVISGMPIAAVTLKRREMLAVLGWNEKVSNTQINTQQHCREPFRYFALAACRSKERAEIPKRPVYGCAAWQEMTPKTPKAHQCPKA